MKVTVDMENLGNMVQDVVEKNLNSLIENEVRKSIESKVASSARDIISTIVNEKMESYVNEYITTATVSVGGGWNSEPKTYTVEEYIKQQISEIMQNQAFKTKDRYGDYTNKVTFEEYVKGVFNVDASVQRTLDQFMKKTRDDVNRNITKMFDQTTQAALSSVIMDMLNNSNAFLDMRDKLKRITDGT
jgi:hypothetical protein